MGRRQQLRRYEVFRRKEREDRAAGCVRRGRDGRCPVEMQAGRKNLPAGRPPLPKPLEGGRPFVSTRRQRSGLDLQWGWRAQSTSSGLYGSHRRAEGRPCGREPLPRLATSRRAPTTMPYVACQVGVCERTSNCKLILPQPKAKCELRSDILGLRQEKTSIRRGFVDGQGQVMLKCERQAEQQPPRERHSSLCMRTISRDYWWRRITG